MRAKCPERGIHWQVAFEQTGGRRREKDLADVRDRSDASGTVDLVTGGARGRVRNVAGVDSHANVPPRAIRPVVLGESTLDPDRCSHTILRGREGGEQRIASSGEVDAVVRHTLRPEVAVMLGNHLRVRVVTEAEERRGTVDVSAEKRDRPDRPILRDLHRPKRNPRIQPWPYQDVDEQAASCERRQAPSSRRTGASP
jgi:hypothetical protein